MTACSATRQRCNLLQKVTGELARKEGIVDLSRTRVPFLVASDAFEEARGRLPSILSAEALPRTQFPAAFLHLVCD